MTAARIDHNLRSLILEKLDAPYTSLSTIGQIPTGNHYQSVKLGDLRTRGFRNDRAEILDQIDFTAKKVLDLGSNLGELSRETRARGARLVDGFESDSYLIDLAEAINVFNGTTRVSFYQRDITDPVSYDEEYDIVLAFSIFTYIRNCLPRIAEITNLLVVETHKLDGNFDAYYIDPLTSYFPHFRILGLSDWGANLVGEEARAIVMFGKREDDLLNASRPPETQNERLLESPGPPLPTLQTGVRYIDVNRTLFDLRFSTLFDDTFNSSDDLLRAVDQMEFDLETLEAARDLQLCYGGWLYWLLYVKGYCQYVRSGEVGPGNIYYDYLVRHPDRDPGIAEELRDADTAQTFVVRRYRDMDLFRYRSAEGNVPNPMEPVFVLSGPGPLKDQDSVYEIGRAAPILARRIDGWHRLFAAKLFGVTQLPFEFAHEEDVVRPIYGEIKDVKANDSMVEVEGWCIDPEARIDAVEVRPEEGAAQICRYIWSEDAARAFPGLPREGISGFVLKSQRDGQRDSVLRLELIALSDQLPIGRMSIRVFPEINEERKWPQSRLARRLWGTENPRACSIRGSNCAHDLLTAVGRYRSLESHRSVLDWSCGAGLLQPFIRRYLPDAQITGIDFDEDAVRWCREAGFSETFSHAPAIPPTEFRSESFDLVLGHSALTRLGSEEQRAWLEELSRLIKRRGYAALSVNGELVRPLLKEPDVVSELDREGICVRASEPPRDSAVTYQTEVFTRRECGRFFDVVMYAKGGVYNQQDLIILRKP
jgi:2-polyprenyl-3-methyl-5-hydroxy-6-metoxy-1,4-benzoquinol methylase